VERKLFRLVAAYAFDGHTTNETISELNNLTRTIVDYKRKCTQHILSMNNMPLSSLVYEYIPSGSRHVKSSKIKDGDIHTHKNVQARKWLKF
jgi:hypothetical protein